MEELNRWVKNNPYSFALFLALIVAIIVGLSVGLTRQVKECPRCPSPDECPACPQRIPMPINLIPYNGTIPDCPNYEVFWDASKNPIDYQKNPVEILLGKFKSCNAPLRVKLKNSNLNNTFGFGIGYFTKGKAGQLGIKVDKDRYLLYATEPYMNLDMRIDGNLINDTNPTFLIWNTPTNPVIAYQSPENKIYYLPLPKLAIFSDDGSECLYFIYVPSGNYVEGHMEKLEVCSSCKPWVKGYNPNEPKPVC